MYQTVKRVVSLAFVLILILGLTIPAFAADGTVTPNEGEITVFLGNSKGMGGLTRIQIASGTKNFTIKRSSIRVSGADAKLVGFQKQFNTNMQESDPHETGEWSQTYDSAYCSYYVQLKIVKTGTVTVKYKIGSTQYKMKVKIVPYVNPVKSITVTGVNNSKSFAAKTKSQSWLDNNVRLPLKATTKNAKIAIKASTGWKVQNVYFRDEKTFNTISYYYNSPVTSARIPVGTLNAGRNYGMRVDYFNPKSGFTFTVWYNIHGVNAA